MIRLFWRWLVTDVHFIPHWTPEKAQHLQRQYLEREGLAGFHFSWSRVVLREGYNAALAEDVNDTPVARVRRA